MENTHRTRVSEMVDEYAEVIKLTQGLNSLNDDQLTQVKDQVWQSYVNNQLIAAEAKKLGLTVSDAEIQAIIEEGTHPLLMQTPFRNPQTGAFDKDMLKSFGRLCQLGQKPNACTVCRILSENGCFLELH